MNKVVEFFFVNFEHIFSGLHMHAHTFITLSTKKNWPKPKKKNIVERHSHLLEASTTTMLMVADEKKNIALEQKTHKQRTKTILSICSRINYAYNK